LAPTTAITGVFAFSAVRIILAMEARSMTTTRTPWALRAAAVCRGRTQAQQHTSVQGLNAKTISLRGR
jgi:hypothetical protein